MSLEVDIEHLEAGSPDEFRGLLASLFPAAGEYVIEPTGDEPIVVEFSHAPGEGDDAGAICKAVFPRDGRYVVSPFEEFRKAKPPVEAQQFEEWFLERLFQEAEKRYASSRRLVMRVVERFIADHGGNLSDQQSFVTFEELLFDLRRATGLSIGMPVAADVRKRLAEIGFTDQEVFDWPALSYRFGLVYRSVGPTATFSWDRALALANAIELTDTERAAMVFARQEAALHLSPVVLRDPLRVWEEAAAEEQRLVRVMTRRAIRDRGGALELARDLHKRMDDDGITRDWERVARTEIAEARNRGSWAAETRGANAEARFYRDTTTRACNGCLRLLRHPDGTPRTFTLKEIQEQDALGPNHGPKETWHLRIGTIHPNCLCPPWARAGAPQLEQDFGRFSIPRATHPDFPPSLERLHRRTFGKIMRERGLD